METSSYNRLAGNFDEDWYRLAYPDVADGIAAGRVRSGLEHYLAHGQFEGRFCSSADKEQRKERQYRADGGGVGADMRLPIPSLICVGLEKCGTTTLDKALRTSRHLACAKGIKEISFFAGVNGDRDRDWYMSLFEDAGWRQKRYLVDVTPSYIRNNNALARIKAICASGTKLILCLRNPVYRAYSHYVHDICLHHCNFDPAIYPVGQQRYDAPYQTSFFDEKEQSNRYHFTAYAPLLKSAIEAIGRENILVLITERDFTSPEVLTKKIGQFASIDGFSLKFVNKENGMRFPRYIYSSNMSTIVSAPGNSEEVPPGCLAVVRGNSILKLGSANERTAFNVLSAASRWTSGLSAAQARSIFDRHFKQDVLELESLLAQDIPEWKQFYSVSA
jgi:hypothetical protein